MQIAIITMQQQIYIESEDQALPAFAQLKTENPPPLEELISEHYDEDFDSAPDLDSVKSEPEIIQEVSECIQNAPLQTLESPFIELQSSSNSSLQLLKQCQQLKDQIKMLEQQLVQKEAQISKLQSSQHSERISQYQQLLELRNSNQQILANQSEESEGILVSFLGKDTISAPLILAAYDSQEDKLVQQRLIQEGVRLNALLHCTSNEIAKLKREVAKNGDQLAVVDQVKEEMFSRHHSVFRQLQEKKQRWSRNQTKLADLDRKIEQLSSKMGNLQSKSSVEDPKKVNQKQKWQQLMNDKDKLQKKVKIAQHTQQQSIISLRRTVCDLKRQIRQLQLEEKELNQKNSKVEEQSNNKLTEFNSVCERRSRIRPKNKTNHFLTQEQQIHPVEVPQPSAKIFLQKRRNYSTQSRELPSNNPTIKQVHSDLEDNLHSSAIKAPDQPCDRDIINEIENKLKECSTDGTLRKQFKLKLPHKTSKNSRKYLDLSQQNPRKEPTIQKKSQKGKLSITERLERIQLLQKEDKRYSVRLESEKKKRIERQSLRLIRGISDSKHQQVQKENDKKSNGCNRSTHQLAEQLTRESRLVASPQDVIDESTKNKPEERLQTELDYKLPLLSGRPEAKVSLKSREINTETCSLSEQKVSNPLKSDITNNSMIKAQNLGAMMSPKNLFSSIQQKLLMRQSSARQTFNLSQSNILKESVAQGMPLETSFIQMSRVSRHSSLVRRRGEKKISDEYMKILEERGRRILQLENEGD